MIKKIYIMIMFSLCFLYADNNSTYDDLFKKKNSNNLATESSDNSAINKFKFIHEITPENSNYSSTILDRFKKIKNGTLSISILNKPISRRIKDVNTIYIHPSLANTIYFPKNFKMTKPPLFSFEINTKNFLYTPNTVSFLVPKNFINGNIIVTGYDLDSKRNYFFTIFVEKIIYSKLLFDKVLKRYLIEDNVFSLINKFYFYKKIDPYTLINKYLEINHISNIRDLRKVFKENGAYDILITPDNQKLYIIRDENNYDIQMRNVKFKISPEFSISNPSSRIEYE